VAADRKHVTQRKEHVMAKAKVGSIVNADFGQGPAKGVLLAHGDDKDIVIPLDVVAQLGYREPEDRDEHGSGRTWWNEK
jgi:hypothetical protein